MIDPTRQACILAVVYRESYWTKTAECIAACNAPTFLVSRSNEGAGSLSEAFNRGFRDNNLERFEFVWMVTNVTFKPTVMSQLVNAMIYQPEFGAIHPSFSSDHKFLRQRPGTRDVVEAPFVEFTAPLVRASVFANVFLDEDMPYVGHDLDWGIRARKLGFLTGVYHGDRVEHTYIRHSKTIDTTTAHRKRLRLAAIQSTRAALARKYGADWRKTCAYTI